MKLKGKENSSWLKKTTERLQTKIKKKYLLIVLIIFFFMAGILLGTVTSNFYEKIESGPVRSALNWMQENGFSGIFERLFILKENMVGIKEENIWIPLNYLKGLFSNPEKIYIDISFENYQKIVNKQKQSNQAIIAKGPFQMGSGFLFSSAEDYVPATITQNNKEVKVKLRLKGEGGPHITGDKWSYRIVIRDNVLFGMKEFSIQNPDEMFYLQRFLFYEMMKKEGIVSPRIYYIDVTINGEHKGIYALEEHSGTEMIENCNKLAGLILKFESTTLKEDIFKIFEDLYSKRDYYDAVEKYELDGFYNSNIETFNNEDFLTDPSLSKQFEKARILLEQFRRGSLKTSKVFDIEKLAKYFAINSLLGDAHSSAFTNIRFYYNPLTSLIEPVSYDMWQITDTSDELDTFFPDCLALNENDACSQKKGLLSELMFKDPIFFEQYIKELEKVSEKGYLDELLAELDNDIQKNLNIIHKEKPSYHFSTEQIYNNQKIIKRKIENLRKINAYLQTSVPSSNKVVLAIGNTESLPIEVVGVVYNSTEIRDVQFDLKEKDKYLQPRIKEGLVEYKEFEFEFPVDDFQWDEESAYNLKLIYKVPGAKNIYSVNVLPWPYPGEGSLIKDDFIRKEPNAFSPTFTQILNINKEEKTISFKKGNLILLESLVIPAGFGVLGGEGTTIDLKNEATLLSYSPIEFIGSEERPFTITSSDKTGQGIVIIKADSTSVFKNVVISNLKNPSKQGWELTGAVTFYESPLEFENVIIKNTISEDSLNIKNTRFKINKLKIINAFSDCLDFDFDKGIIENSIFMNCGGDGLDFSGSTVAVKNFVATNIADKGISVGEKSKIIAENIEITNSFIGFASKDLSTLLINKATITNSDYGFAVYQKKPEYGPATIEATGVDVSNLTKEYIVEKDSSLTINNLEINKKEKSKDVYAELYS